MTTSVGASRDEQGFTLLELVVAMGLLTGFLLMLVRLLGTGVGLFDEGERGQELLDRAQAATRAAREALLDSCGPRLVGRPGGAPDARLIVHYAPLGADAARVQVVRSTVRLSAAREEQLLEAAFVALAREDGADERQAEEAARERLRTWPRSGRGEMLLLPWPVDAEGVFWELRRGDRPAEPLLLPADELALVELAEPADLALDPERVLATTRVLVTGILHFEFALWSQRTRSWDVGGSRGAEVTWDSARAGLLTGEKETPEDFGLDLGFPSLRDPRDDVWPRWVRLTVVVARSRAATPESYLSRAIGDNENTITVTRPEELPDPLENPWVKIGPEWVRFQGATGSTLTGVRRGQRGTTARQHAAGTPVRAGRMVVVHVPLAHGRDADE